jgi:flagellar motility protein MotE (MotC chaperone)
MMRFIRHLRIIPIALIASACLLALKTADLLLDGGYLIGGDNAPVSGAEASVTRATADAPLPGASRQGRSWAQQMFNYPSTARNPGSAGGAADALPVYRGPRPLPSLAPLAADKPDADITGTVDEDKSQAKAKGEGAAAADKDGKEAKGGKEAKDGKAKAAKEKSGSKGDDGGGDAKAKDGAGDAPPNGTVIETNGALLPSSSERAILERLQERRKELDARARELDIREGLIAAAEKRVEGKISELKQAQAQVGTAEQRKDEAEIARLKGLVTMYENMKPRDAAKIFDHLEMSVLIEVASQINPRKMSDILALMSAETADRLTVELANRSQGAGRGGNSELPKIEGRPATP